MPVPKVQMGQVWKKSDTGEAFLITKVYPEGLSTVAVLRKAGAESEGMTRVKVERAKEGQTLPGFVYAQETEEF